MKPIWIIEATYKKDFKIYLKFSNGRSGIVDLYNKLIGPVFEPLSDQQYFINFKLNDWSIEWPNGADLAPEYLYEQIQSHQDME